MEVYFRDFARLHTQKLRLVGWARNLPDGDIVEVLAEGARPALEQILHICGEVPEIIRGTGRHRVGCTGA